LRLNFYKINLISERLNKFYAYENNMYWYFEKFKILSYIENNFYQKRLLFSNIMFDLLKQKNMNVYYNIVFDIFQKTLYFVNYSNNLQKDFEIFDLLKLDNFFFINSLYESIFVFLFKENSLILDRQKELMNIFNMLSIIGENYLLRFNAVDVKFKNFNIKEDYLRSLDKNLNEKSIEIMDKKIKVNVKKVFL